jgi:hypothetical protein
MYSVDPDDVASRRAARGTWPVSVHALGESNDDLSDLTTPAERIAMMKELAESAWRLSGRPLQSDRRSEIPGRLFRRGEVRPDDDDV